MNQKAGRQKEEKRKKIRERTNRKQLTRWQILIPSYQQLHQIYNVIYYQYILLSIPIKERLSVG